MEVVNYEKILLCMIGVMQFFCSFSATDSRENDYGEGFSKYLEIRFVDSEILNTSILKVFHLLNQ